MTRKILHLLLAGILLITTTTITFAQNGTQGKKATAPKEGGHTGNGKADTTKKADMKSKAAAKPKEGNRGGNGKWKGIDSVRKG